MWRIEATGTPLAGAIFTDEEIKLLFAIMIVFLIAAVLVAAVVLRSAIRLIKAPNGERSPKDQAIVVVASLVLVSVLVEPILARIGDYRDQRAAVNLIAETSAIPEDEFENGRWWNSGECTQWVMPLRGRPSTFANRELAATNDQLVRSEVRGCWMDGDSLRARDSRQIGRTRVSCRPRRRCHSPL